MQVQFEPLEQWPKGHAPATVHKSSPFRATYSDTLSQLDHELRQLRARAVVIQADLDPRDIRLDGLLRAHARPRSPGIVLSFEVNGESFMYPCDTYRHWQDNLRAIVLTLEKLRAVDRYGVSKHGEQYRGWKALPENVDERVTPEDAAVVLLRTAGEAAEAGDVDRVLIDSEYRRKLGRRALAMAHPDRQGGTAAHFHRVQHAREVLEAV